MHVVLVSHLCYKVLKTYFENVENLLCLFYCTHALG